MSIAPQYFFYLYFTGNMSNFGYLRKKKTVNSYFVDSLAHPYYGCVFYVIATDKTSKAMNIVKIEG